MYAELSKKTLNIGQNDTIFNIQFSIFNKML